MDDERDGEDLGWICSEMTSHIPPLSNSSESETPLSFYHLSPFVFRLPKWMKTRCPKQEPPCLPVSVKLRVSPKQGQPENLFQGRRHLLQTQETDSMQSGCLAISNELNILGPKEKGSNPWIDEDGDLDVPRGNVSTMEKMKETPLKHIQRDQEGEQTASITKTPSERKQGQEREREDDNRAGKHEDEDEKEEERQIWLEYKTQTRLYEVGAQVWRGSLFLADFLLNNPEPLRGKRVLEIGAGTGLSSVVALLCQPQGLVATDLAFNLDLLERNLARNVSCLSGILASQSQMQRQERIYRVMPCDIKTIISDRQSGNARAQTGDALVELGLTARQLTCEMDVYLGADLVYDHDLSEALVDFIRHIACSLMSETTSKDQIRMVWLSIDKRYIFTLEDVDIKAPMYEHFRHELDKMLAHLPQKIKIAQREHGMNDVTQYFQYETSNDLIILEIIFSLKT